MTPGQQSPQAGSRGMDQHIILIYLPIPCLTRSMRVVGKSDLITLRFVFYCMSQTIISLTYKHRAGKIFLVKINSGTRKRLQNGDNISLQRTRVILRSPKRDYDQFKPYYRITLAPF